MCFAFEIKRFCESINYFLATWLERMLEPIVNCLDKVHACDDRAYLLSQSTQLNYFLNQLSSLLNATLFEEDEFCLF